MVGFCVLLISILWLLQIVFLDEFYKQIKLRQVSRDAQYVSAYLGEGDLDTLSNFLHGRNDLYVEVWNPNRGSIVVTTGNFSNTIQSRLSAHSKLSLFERVKVDGVFVERFEYEESPIGPGRRGTRQIESILYADVLTMPNGYQNLLMVSSNLTPVQSTVDTLRVQIYFISGIMLVLSIVIALLISRRVSAPIEKLSHSARELGKGNYDVPFEVKGYREISELSETLTHAASELSKTESLRQELIANVSHDLRTPLTLITGYAEMMRDLPGENTAENMQVIADESKRLTTLVEGLLDLSRLQSKTVEIKPEELSITGCINDIIGRMSRFLEKDNYIIRFDYTREAIVLADPERISQVVYNLLANALTYTGEDRIVTVRQIENDLRVTIEVIDTGNGISPEELPYIWDRYYRSHESHKRAVTGAGIGLSIVRWILQAHPEVEYGVSSQLGQGSVFWFSLPLTDIIETGMDDG